MIIYLSSSLLELSWWAFKMTTVGIYTGISYLVSTPEENHSNSTEAETQHILDELKEIKELIKNKDIIENG
jgi:hypothetical protein